MTKIPKYLQVEKYIIDLIENNTLEIGDQIETEDMLVEKFGFSKMTINKALNNLVDKDYIRRVSGRGSFVKSKHITKNIKDFTSFSDDMRDIGLTPGSKLISYSVIHSNEIPEIAEKLQVDKEALIHYFIRLRTGNNQPIALSYNYIPIDVLPALNIKALDGSLYEYIKSLNFELVSNDLEIEAKQPSEELRNLLKINDGAILQTKGLTTIFDKNVNLQKILGYFITQYNGEIYTYRSAE